MAAGSKAAPPSAALVHAVLALGGFAIGTGEFASMSLLPAYTAGFGVDAPSGGRVISAYALGVVIGAPAFAVLGARLARKRMLLLTLGWFVLGNLATALAPSFGSLVAMRFLTGLPHGAYFGFAALVAASLVPAERRTAAVGRVLSGITIATIAGVPVATVLGRAFGWRASFDAIALLAGVTLAAIVAVLPADRPDRGASPLRELGALRRAQVWFALAIGAVGFGGLFAVYAYLASTLQAVTHASDAAIPIVFAVFGAGMTLGNFMAPWFARRGPMSGAGRLLAWSAAALALYPATTGSVWSIALAVGLIGIGAGLGAVLQARLMDVAGDAQGLAAALNHSAFNTANALGPLLGGLAITAGWGWSSTGWVGCGLSLAGLAVWAAARRAAGEPIRS